MAQPYSRGAVHMYIGIGAGGAPIYLGTGERAPRVSIRKRFRDLGNDLGGDEPFDFAYMGKGGTVVVKLTRWNDGPLAIWESVVGVAAGADAGGIDALGNIGTLMITEQQGVPLWIQYAYGSGGIAPKGAYATMRPGWHFLATWLEGPDDHEGGTDPATEALVIRCARVYQPTLGSFTLYDRNMGGLPPVN